MKDDPQEVSKKEELKESLLDGAPEPEENNFQISFKEHMIIELEKVAFFFKENYNYNLQKFEKIKEQLNYIKHNKQFIGKKEILESAIKELFKEANLMKGYIELNFKAKYKILKKYKKCTSHCSTKLDVASEVENVINSGILKEAERLISNLITDIEKLFSFHFFDKYSFNSTKILKDYISTTYFTQIQSFYFGFFNGISLVLIILCLIIGYYFKIDMDDDEEFKSIFPMFRAYLILCMYFWMLGLNVYCWNIANVNYKLCFQFTSHYSDTFSVFKRAAIFSAIFVLMILCYMVIRAEIPILSEVISFIPLELTPLFCWVCLIIYVFSPFKIFNYLGRVYMFKLFIESMLIKTEFKHIWFTDQLTSMVGPLRDIEYSLCYYVHYHNSFEEKNQICNSNRVIVLLIGVAPHLIRAFQCFRIIFDSKKVFPSILNAGKYFFAILVAIISFFNFNTLFYNLVWLLVAIISTIYSYYWDILMDFGFLQKDSINYPFRDNLSYKNKFFYYFCMISNFFLRFMWILSMSPEMVAHLIRPELLSLMIYSFEVLRRGMWNFIRVEYKHIEICKEFKVTMKVELPFRKDKEGRFFLRDGTILDYVKMNQRIKKLSTKYVDSVLRKQIFNGNTFENRSKTNFIDEDLKNKLGSFIKHHKNITEKLSYNKVGKDYRTMNN